MSSESAIDGGLSEDSLAASEEESAEGIHISAPKEPEVNPEIYRDVESLLYKGFIYAPVTINGVRMVFRSLNHHELEYLSLVTDPSDITTYYIQYLSKSLLYLETVNMLVAGDRSTEAIESMFEDMNNSARDLLISNLSTLSRRVSKAVTLTEAYQMEKVSRFRWAQLSGQSLTSTEVTGIAGTGNLGLNYAQLIWTALNKFEDKKEEWERHWDNAKFIGSCSAGKGIKKIYAQDRDRRQKEAEERTRRKDSVLKLAILGVEDTSQYSKNGVQLIVPRTVEELAQQLEKDLRGEKDWHDRVVSEAESRLQKEIQDKEQRMLRQAEEFDQKLAQQESTDLMTPLSEDEIRERIRQQKIMKANQPDLEQQEKVVQAMKKYHSAAVVPSRSGEEGSKPFRR